MNTKEREKNRGRFATVAVAACAALLCPVVVMAAGTVCTKTVDQICGTNHSATWTTDDCDRDGFTDYEECATGITLTGLVRTIPKYDPTNSASPDTLDPSKPDLFYQMINAATTLDLAPGSKLYDATEGSPQLYASALNVKLHLVKKADIQSGSDRFLIWTKTGGSGTTKSPYTYSARLKAALIKEDTATTAGSLGITKEGNPYGPMTPTVISTIYTQRIANTVNNSCKNASGSPIKCSIVGPYYPTITNVTNTGTFDNTEIINYYIRQVVSHELAHASFLAVPKSTDVNSPAYNSTASTTNYHYTDQSLIMAPASTFSATKDASGVITEGLFVIGTVFDPKLDTYGLTLK